MYVNKYTTTTTGLLRIWNTEDSFGTGREDVAPLKSRYEKALMMHRSCTSRCWSRYHETIVMVNEMSFVQNQVTLHEDHCTCCDRLAYQHHVLCTIFEHRWGRCPSDFDKRNTDEVWYSFSFQESKKSSKKKENREN